MTGFSQDALHELNSSCKYTLKELLHRLVSDARELLGCPDPLGLLQALALCCGTVDVCSCAVTVVLQLGKRCAQQNAQLSVKLSNYFNLLGVLEQAAMGTESWMFYSFFKKII